MPLFASIPSLTKITDAPFCFDVLSRLRHQCGGGIAGDRARGVRVGVSVTKMGFVFERRALTVIGVFAE